MLSFGFYHRRHRFRGRRQFGSCCRSSWFNGMMVWF
ncbi:hypothetical protein F383_12058 [Gossypium arboreum]|uniref:Uncharacterized protein n=1 Tax=Gossypium arboreum TaxID=29729 RepID=A0A0B0PWQ3_GOSAR|nr:hypothetical protein F383_12058 [Gossypium arboreum]